jgi:hypothetical protein
MKFVIIYREHLETHVKNILAQECGKGHRFDMYPVANPMFSTRAYWPDAKECLNLPKDVQFEQVVWEDSQLKSLKKLLLDAEIVLTPEQPPAKVEP